jgi:hypothetical protein
MKDKIRALKNTSTLNAIASIHGLWCAALGVMFVLSPEYFDDHVAEWTFLWATWLISSSLVLFIGAIIDRKAFIVIGCTSMLLSWTFGLCMVLWRNPTNHLFLVIASGFWIVSAYICFRIHHPLIPRHLVDKFRDHLDEMIDERDVK